MVSHLFVRSSSSQHLSPQLFLVTCLRLPSIIFTIFLPETGLWFILIWSMNLFVDPLVIFFVCNVFPCHLVSTRGVTTFIGKLSMEVVASSYVSNLTCVTFNKAICLVIIFNNMSKENQHIYCLFIVYCWFSFFSYFFRV